MVNIFFAAYIFLKSMLLECVYSSGKSPTCRAQIACIIDKVLNFSLKILQLSEVHHKSNNLSTSLVVKTLYPCLF